MQNSNFKISSMNTYSMSNTILWGAAQEGTGNALTTTQQATAGCITDSLGNVYTYVTADTNGGTILIKDISDGATATLSTTASGTTQVLVKRNAAGTALWVARHTLAGPGNPWVLPGAVTCDSSNNVYVAGHFFTPNTMTFRSATGATRPRSVHGCTSSAAALMNCRHCRQAWSRVYAQGWSSRPWRTIRR